MSDYAELKRLAEAAEQIKPGRWIVHRDGLGPEFEPNPRQTFGVDDAHGCVVVWHGVGYNGIPIEEIAAYIAAANPAAVLAMIAESEQCSSRLRDVATLCATVEQERDQLRADLERQTELRRQEWNRAEGLKMRVKELDLLFGRYLLGMRAAVIEMENGKGAEAAMAWIWNGLAGPGELPPEDETDAQAYFDREIKAVDAGMAEVMDFFSKQRAMTKEAAQ